MQLQQLIKMTGRAALLIGSSVLVPGCANVQTVDSGARPALASAETQTITDPLACLDSLAQRHSTSASGLNPARIRSLSWNLEKGLHSDALYQLGVLSSGIDLVVVQEAPLSEQIITQLPNFDYWSFAPGYQAKAGLTGVMTLSRSAPLTHCVFAVDEPWLGTPKAIGLTEYALRGQSQSLLVINVHAVNFTFTSEALAKQLEVFAPFVDAHQGPIVLSGDFNTWSEARLNELQAFATRHNLTVLEFEVDNRTRVFGRVLDHVLVRDVEVIDTTTMQVDTSDHNALWAEFRITESS